MHRLAAIKPKNIGRLGRSFTLSRVLRNVETVSSPPPPTPPPAGFTASPPEVHGRKMKSIAGVSLQSREAPAALIELDERVRALEAVANVEEEPVVHEATYSEQDLAAFCQDILANPFEQENDELRVDEQAVRKARATEDTAIVEALYERFDVNTAASSSSRPYMTIVSRLESIVSRLEAAERIANPDSDAVTQEQQSFPISIFTPRECEALVRTAMWRKDTRSAEQILSLMKRTGLSVPETSVTDVLQHYSRSGDATSADKLLAKYVSGPPSDIQKHLHIQAHLNGTPSTTIPTSALDVLHSYENRAVAAPMQTYTSVITSLFSRPSSIARGQAWDLFAHMRYIAHPDPDVLLYTLMIRACASPLSPSLSSEAEKALDLWTEMTVDHRLTPTVGAYNAVILACARDGSKKFVSEAFRIARQMLDSHRDAQGVSAYRPDRKTFAALLEGAKRLGDLARVRWILAEMTRSQEGLEALNAPVNAEVDEEIMVHVFNAYAAYKPPFARAAMKVVSQAKHTSTKGKASQQTPTFTPQATAVEASESGPTAVADAAHTPSFAHIPPQTHGELIQEVNFLFRSIIEAQSSPSTEFDTSAPLTPHKFRNVQLTPKLVTAYVSVLYAHASLYKAREIFRSIYPKLHMQRPIRAYVEAFERCAIARKNRDGGHERELALTFADELWKEWSAIEHEGKYQEQPLDARMVERVNVAMVRVLTLNEEIDRAMGVIRAFAARYKPQTVRIPPPKPALRSTKTVLAAHKPLVRMTSPTEVPDDYVPPLLSFKDLELLHHRLVAYGRTKDIGYLTWLCKAYEWALRVRRDEATKYIPPNPNKQTAPVLATP